MLPLSEDLLFVWEPADLVMSWHAPRLPKREGENNFSLKSCDESENFDFKEGLYYGAGYFFEGVQGFYGENRKLHNCSIIN